ncbi:single-stranded DNA-binding protein [Mycobacterium eburneum]|nr:single-stranded DNA-binding protein [Mycobacterium eburneum]
MSANTITISGNVTADPELRFTPSGKAVANFTVADTPRYLDEASGQWKDGEPLFQRVVAWGDLAENIAETLARGAAVIVTGRLNQKSFQNSEGEKKTYTEIRAEDIGASLKYATATIAKVNRKK